MLELYDRALRRRAVLHLAYDRVEEQLLNAVGRLTFRLPGDDPKAAQVQPHWFVKADGGDYYRVTADGLQAADTGERVFEAEHALATLADDVMFGPHVIGGHGMHTRAVLEYILSQQTEKRWVLGDCEFDMQMEYGFESENLLYALLSVPGRFVEPCRWEVDMRAYPWTVSLRRLRQSGVPRYYIRAGQNLLSHSSERAGLSICTRLYLLGYGEGINQLTIADANGGVPYLEASPEAIARWGTISRVYVDRTFEDAQGLKERGQALLAMMENPRYTRTFDLADLSQLTGQAIDRACAGDIIRMTDDGTQTYITGVRRWLDEVGRMTLTLSTTPTDLAAELADLAKRQLDEQKYAQGATQLYAHGAQGNATPSQAQYISFMIPQEMCIINKVLVKVQLEPFRSFSRATTGGGRSTQTSSAGGGRVVSSAYGGASTQTTSSAGQTTLSAPQTVTLDSGVGFTTDASSLTVTGEPSVSYSRVTGRASGQTGAASAIATGSASGGQTGRATGQTGSASSSSTGSASGSGSHTHGMLHTHGLGSHTHSEGGHTHSIMHTHGMNSHDHPIGEHRHHMSHTHSIFHRHELPGHKHDIPGHSHRVSIPQHSHDVAVPEHTHTVSIPDHTHGIEQGIFRTGRPRRATLTIGGEAKLDMGEALEVDLTEYLMRGKTGKIPRGTWIRLGVLPDDLAFVTIDLFVQGFIQSKGGTLA